MNEFYIVYSLILVIPILIWFLIKSRPLNLLFCFILSIIFIGGSIEQIGIINTSGLGIVVEVSVIFLFIKQYLRSPKTFKLPGYRYIVFYFSISLVSLIFNELSLKHYLLFLRETSIFIFFFWAVFNMDISKSRIKIINRFLMLIFVSQIFINLIKYFSIGIRERYIGTLSISGGSLTTIFSLVGVAFSIAAFFYLYKLKYLLLVFGFFIFAVIGAKKAIIIYIPIVLTLTFLLFLLQNRSEKIYFGISRFKGLITVSVLSVLLFYLSVIFVPKLNPEGNIFGSFDITYLSNFTKEYLFPENSEILYYGRGEAPLAVINLLTSKGLLQTLLGFGPGDLVTSRFLSLPTQRIGRVEDLIAYKYDIGYGARTGILWMMLQVGILGVFTYLLFYVNQFRKIFKQFNKSTGDYSSIFYLGLFSVCFVFLLDYFTYSITMIKLEPIALVFFYLIGIGIQGKVNETK